MHVVHAVHVEPHHDTTQHPALEVNFDHHYISYSSLSPSPSPFLLYSSFLRRPLLRHIAFLSTVLLTLLTVSKVKSNKKKSKLNNLFLTLTLIRYVH